MSTLAPAQLFLGDRRLLRLVGHQELNQKLDPDIKDATAPRYDVDFEALDRPVRGEKLAKYAAEPRVSS